MGHANNMTNLVNKIERRLGLIPLTPHLPERYNKDAWVEVIKDQSLTTFSRYFGWKVPFKVTRDVPTRDGWYIIDEEKYFGKVGVLLGIQDIDWQDFTNDNSSIAQFGGYGGIVDSYTINYNPVDIMVGQMAADVTSLFNHGIYIDYREPNMFRLYTAAGQPLTTLSNFVVNVILKHPDSLHTISPTKMEIFEELAKADVAEFLSTNLRFWDQMETVFRQVDLKMSDIDAAAQNRERVVDELKQSYVTAANDSIPYLIVI